MRILLPHCIIATHDPDSSICDLCEGEDLTSVANMLWSGVEYSAFSAISVSTSEGLNISFVDQYGVLVYNDTSLSFSKYVDDDQYDDDVNYESDQLSTSSSTTSAPSSKPTSHPPEQPTAFSNPTLRPTTAQPTSKPTQPSNANSGSGISRTREQWTESLVPVLLPVMVVVCALLLICFYRMRFFAQQRQLVPSSEQDDHKNGQNDDQKDKVNLTVNLTQKDLTNAQTRSSFDSDTLTPTLSQLSYITRSTPSSNHRSSHRSSHSCHSYDKYLQVEEEKSYDTSLAQTLSRQPESKNGVVSFLHNRVRNLTDRIFQHTGGSTAAYSPTGNTRADTLLLTESGPS